VGSVGRDVEAQAPAKARGKGPAADIPAGVREYTSKNFVVRTDLPPEEARGLLERLETMIAQVGRYWGQPNKQIIEMYVVHSLDVWPAGSIPPEPLQSIASGGGLTVSQTLSAVNPTTGRKAGHIATKSVVYAVADRGTPLHEAVHAYCSQTFGTAGPTWFAEGIAELGQYWRDKDISVQIHPGVLDYLQGSDPVPLEEIVDLSQRTGDSWQNYAWRWALCHMLAFNPNYAQRFRPLGLDILNDGRETFQSVYGPMAPEISFEYLQFLEHLDNGYRVDLCSWNWKVKPVGLKGKNTLTAKIDAGRGWQPARLLAKADQTYAYTAEGDWETADKDGACTADGLPDGVGKLVGVLFQDYQLSEPFDLGATGTWTAPSDGALFVRCQDAWNSLAENSGSVTVKLKLSDAARD
jgi:hypothetical protein